MLALQSLSTCNGMSGCYAYEADLADEVIGALNAGVFLAPSAFEQGSSSRMNRGHPDIVALSGRGEVIASGVKAKRLEEGAGVKSLKNRSFSHGIAYA